MFFRRRFNLLFATLLVAVAALVYLNPINQINAGVCDVNPNHKNCQTPTPSPTPGPSPTPTPTPTPFPGGAAILVGAGDIARCPTKNGAEKTASLLDNISGTVFTTGDNAYSSGTTSEFDRCYDPTWGRHKARTRPTAGNHDYGTTDAVPYFTYFGASAGNIGEGYYSYNIGSWRAIAINSNCGDIGGCETSSAQYQWLANELSANPSVCTVAYWHHPRFTIGPHDDEVDMDDIWNLLFSQGVDVVVTGHDHNYQRWTPMNGAGSADTNGIRQFVVGTGGRSLTTPDRSNPLVEADDHSAFGVIKLSLFDGGYNWDFVPVAGESFTDSGSSSCH